MAIYLKTNDPRALLKAFDSHIAQTGTEGKITTWERHADGIQYTHRAVDWADKAFFKAAIDAGHLRFNIVRPKRTIMDTAVYSYYHGHLIETFIKHFPDMFTFSFASSMPIGDDNVQWKLLKSK
jgi:hypothetical protein